MFICLAKFWRFHFLIIEVNFFCFAKLLSLAGNSLYKEDSGLCQGVYVGYDMFYL